MSEAHYVLEFDKNFQIAEGTVEGVEGKVFAPGVDLCTLVRPLRLLNSLMSSLLSESVLKREVQWYPLRIIIGRI
jgi:hypothetical protein